MKKLDFPINRVSIDLTERCNLACSYCFTYGRGKRDLTFQQGIKTIDWLFRDEISQSNEVEINWWGGEPFLKFNLMRDLTEYAVKKAQKEGKRLIVGGTSNVTLWDKSVVDWMDTTKAYFMMSIDGIKEVQDKHRITINGDGSYKQIINLLPYIIKKIPFIRSRMAPTSDTVGKLYESIKFYYDMGITTQMFSPVFESNWTDESFMIAKDNLVGVVLLMIETYKKGKPLNIIHFDNNAKSIYLGKNKPEFPCGAGRFYCGISVSGIIYPCHRFNKYGKDSITYFGSIEDGIIFPNFRKAFINFLDDTPEKCKDCKWYGNLCDVSCYAVNHDLTGDISTPPEVYCKWMNILGDVSHFYYSKLKDENLPIKGLNNNIQRSCICNNMCYLEGTENEITTLDRATKSTCICYNTMYNGEMNPKVRSLLNG